MKNKPGMTLVEIMIGVFLSSLVLGAGFQIFNSSQKKLTKASTRQVLANEVKVAIKNMAQDFKAVKADSLEFNVANTGNSGVISFDRYMITGQGDQEQLSFDRFEHVVYEFRKPFLTRNVGGRTHTLARHLDSLNFSRPEGPEPAADGSVNYDEGWAARIDITMSGSKKIPGSTQMATHTESVSVFMLEEYYKLVNKNRFVGLSHLAQNDDTKVLDEDFDLDSYFASSLDPEELAKLTRDQLNNLRVKENSGLTEAETRLDELNDAIDGVDAAGTRVLGFLWRRSTDVSDIQDQLADHDTVAEIENDVRRLQSKIDDYEEDNMRDSFGDRVNISSMDKETQEYKDYKEAYDMMVRDRSMREAYNANKQEGDPDYVGIMDSYNPTTMRQGIVKDSDGNDVTFTETAEEFATRREKAAAIHDRCQQIDLGWMDDNSGEQRVKLYTAAKDLMDMAETKLSYVKQRDAHRDNIGKIDDAIRNLRS